MPSNFFKIISFYWLFMLCFVGATSLSAQLNIKVGYGFSYTNPTATNRMIQEYNTTNDFLSDPLNELHNLHGMLAGLRYRANDVAFELTWSNKFSTLKSDGINPLDDTDFARDLLFRYGTYSLGMEGYLTKFLGMGASIDLENIRFRSDVTDIDKRYTVFTEWGYGSHFYLSLNIPGNDILTLSIKPFVQIPWSVIDVSPLNPELNTTPLETIDTQEKFLNFGVQLVFYNGVW